jgi:ribosome-associated protein
LEKNALEVIALDVRKLTTMCDYFLLATGAVDVHLKAIVDNIEGELKRKGVRPFHIEGYDHLNWVLLDYVDVVVHIMLPDVRKFYALEKLWGEAKVKQYSALDT